MHFGFKFGNSDSNIKSAFLKGNTSQHLLNIEAPEDIVKTFGQGRLVKLENQEIELKKEIDKAYLLERLELRIKDLDISMAKRDVEVFIADTRVLDVWSREFFRDIIEKVKVN